MTSPARTHAPVRATVARRSGASVKLAASRPLRWPRANSPAVAAASTIAALTGTKNTDSRHGKSSASMSLPVTSCRAVSTALAATASASTGKSTLRHARTSPAATSPRRNPSSGPNQTSGFAWWGMRKSTSTLWADSWIGPGAGVKAISAKSATGTSVAAATTAPRTTVERAPVRKKVSAR